MKKNMFAMAIAIGLFAVSCNNSQKPAEATHTHDDGTVHSDHDHVAADSTKQDEFKVDSVKTDATHVHDESKPHSH